MWTFISCSKMKIKCVKYNMIVICSKYTIQAEKGNKSVGIKHVNFVLVPPHPSLLGFRCIYKNIQCGWLADTLTYHTYHDPNWVYYFQPISSTITIEGWSDQKCVTHIWIPPLIPHFPSVTKCHQFYHISQATSLHLYCHYPYSDEHKFSSGFLQKQISLQLLPSSSNVTKTHLAIPLPQQVNGPKLLLPSSPTASLLGPFLPFSSSLKVFPSFFSYAILFWSRIFAHTISSSWNILPPTFHQANPSFKSQMKH